jgi:hypothetical protein
MQRRLALLSRQNRAGAQCPGWCQAFGTGRALAACFFRNLAVKITRCNLSTAGRTKSKLIPRFELPTYGIRFFDFGKAEPDDDSRLFSTAKAMEVPKTTNSEAFGLAWRRQVGPLLAGIDVGVPTCCTAAIAVRAFVLELAMNDVVDRILNDYQLIRPLDAERVTNSRRKISGYIGSLMAAGHRDETQLTRYGLAYLKELHEGRDPRFTGC